MALRDWHGWQIGTMWGLGIGFLWLLGRLGDAMAGAGTPGRGSGIGPRIAVTVVILFVVVILLVVTLRWFRARLLDD